VLNALSTAAMVAFEISAWSGGGSGLLEKTTSDEPSMVRKLGAGFGVGGAGAAMASVRSRTSAAGLTGSAG